MPLPPDQHAFDVHAVLLALCGAIPLAMARGLRRHIAAHRLLPAPDPAGLPAVAVILPCRGIDPGLDAVIASVLAQRPGPAQVLLATTADDPVLPLLQAVAGRHPGLVQVVVAPRATTSAQKLANQIAAVTHLAPGVEAVVCVDSDGVLPPDFAARLVSHLARPGVGAATGWRWYVPGAGSSFATLVRSAWNAGAMPFLVDGSHNIAFGGGMAVRREVMAAAGVTGMWAHSISDGLTLAHAVKGMGLRVHFDPRCMVVSREDDSWGSVLEWTNRQATISRCCMPAFWRFTAIAHTASILVLAAAVAAGAWAAGAGGAIAAVALYAVLSAANAGALMAAVAAVLDPAAAAALRQDRQRYLLAAPVAAWLYAVNIARSSLIRSITWRGIRYHLAGPAQVRIEPVRAQTA
ncbi:MAG: glycosyltransferase family 2 protein [Planctomycetes bacterium]|nr:glycosyltransferase family 2 protein [Planctomycetota bacterium]